MRGMRQPKPIAKISDTAEQIGQSIYLQIRRWGPHVPLNVHVKDGCVYALRQAYKVSEVWDAQYPDSFVGSYTRKIDCQRICEDMEIVRMEARRKAGQEA